MGTKEEHRPAWSVIFFVRFGIFVTSTNLQTS